MEAALNLSGSKEYSRRARISLGIVCAAATLAGHFHPEQGGQPRDEREGQQIQSLPPRPRAGHLAKQPSQQRHHQQQHQHGTHGCPPIISRARSMTSTKGAGNQTLKIANTPSIRPMAGTPSSTAATDLYFASLGDTISIRRAAEKLVLLS